MSAGTPVSGAAIFLDRDGTLIRDKHYLHDPDGVELIPGVASALSAAKARGYRLFLLTNQSGIGRGYYTLEQVLACNRRMEELLGLPPPVFDGTCIAPEAPEQPSLYRKPSPRYILESIERHHLDPARCCMVGDNAADYLAGKAAGIRSVMVLTGRHGDPRSQVGMEAENPEVFADLSAALTAILG